MWNYNNIVNNNYKIKKELPKYFVIKRDWDNPLWQKYIDWLNEKYDSTFNWKSEAHYWFEWVNDKYSYLNWVNCWQYIEEFKNNPTLITLESWNECTKWDKCIKWKDTWWLISMDYEKWYSELMNKYVKLEEEKNKLYNLLLKLWA